MTEPANEPKVRGGPKALKFLNITIKDNEGSNR
jgi:hypothetical protein